MKTSQPQRFFGFLISICFVSLLTSCTKKNGSSSAPATDATLRIPMTADAKTFDPQLVEDLYSAISTSMVYEGLLEYHYLKRPHQLVPLLAEALPEVSKDGLTYTFKIRKGVMFQDHPAFPNGKGRELKAKDFVYSFLRLADPKVASGGFWIFDGQIEGLNEWRDKQKNAAVIDYDNPPVGFRATDDYTLLVKLKHKYPQLLFVLAMPQTFVVAREVVEKAGKDFVNTPVGTGPYKLTSWQRNSRLVYEKNPTFRGQEYPSEGEPADEASGLLADAKKQMPFADKVEYHVFIEEQPLWLSFKAANIDESSIPKDNYKEAINVDSKELGDSFKAQFPGVSLQKSPEPDVTYLAFNTEDPVIKKGGKNLRKAIALAINKVKGIELFTNGRAILAHTPVPPGLAGYDETFKNPYSEYNVEEAKKLLAKAGFPNGLELSYESVVGASSRQQAEKLLTELEAIGIKLKVNTNQFSEMTEKINKKTAQMWGIAWIADYPDAENFLQLLYSKNASPGPNGSNFSNKEYDALYEKIKGMMDSPERRKLLHRMYEIFTDELPWIVERHRVAYTLVAPWLKNFKSGYMGSSTAKFLRVDPVQRSQGYKK